MLSKGNLLGLDSDIFSSITPTAYLEKSLVTLFLKANRQGKGIYNDLLLWKDLAMRINRSILIGLAMLFMLSLWGCSSKPSESSVQQKLEQQIGQKSNGLIKLLSLRKTNGIESGSGNYQMQWVAELEFVSDCVWSAESFEARPPPPQGALEWIMIAATRMKTQTKGDRVNLEGTTYFRKTENGWQ